jgi:hypothetical protein
MHKDNVKQLCQTPMPLHYNLNAKPKVWCKPLNVHIFSMLLGFLVACPFTLLFDAFAKWLQCHVRLYVTTLTLGLWPKQGLAKVQAKSESWGSHFMFMGVYEIVREWTPTLPSELPLLELESWCTPKFSKGNCRSQNSLNWKVLYIIGNLLEHRCLKWACMTHLIT